MRVLVCGGRLFKSEQAVHDELWRLHRGPSGPISCVIHGMARGADRYAENWAVESGAPRAGFRPDWSRGPRGGPERNARMLADGKPDLVLAFPGGRGTADMVRRAHAAGVEVIEVPL